MSREVGESFCEYARRWKQTVIDVQPPITDQEECQYFLKSLKDPRYDLMLVVSFEDFSQLIIMVEDVDFKTREGHIAPLIGAQLSTVQGKEVSNDPTSLANHLNQPMPITLNMSSLFAKTLPFSLNVPYLSPLPKHQKAIEPFTLNILNIPLTYFPSTPTPCIALHLSEPRPYTSNRVVTQAKSTQQEDVQHIKALTDQGPSMNLDSAEIFQQHPAIFKELAVVMCGDGCIIQN
ncbi:hypothetical protein G2W53_007901 [Senna tora]|uniref:Uncharacterized protein n=1 Tax=Senna tora TaxID=362788 RepID=A0A834X868_9FABA|nr:hypothetical protein G2W53_007901 [Senna tora]